MPAANYLGTPDYMNMSNWGMPPANPLQASAPTVDAITPWATSTNSSPLSGLPDFLKPAQSFSTPGGAGLDWGGVSSSPGSGGIFDSLKSWGQSSGFLGSTENGITSQGWGGLALGGAQALGNAWMGMQQYGLAKDQLAQSKKQFDLNYGAQQKTTNAALEDRQRARVASNPGAYASVGDYMKKNGI